MNTRIIASTKTALARFSKIGALVATLLVASVIGLLSNTFSATASIGGPDDDGQLLLVSNQVIPAGGTFNGIAGNMSTTQVYRVMPVPTAPLGCRMATVREELTPQANGFLSLFWEVKNVGSTACAFSVRLSFTG